MPAKNKRSNSVGETREERKLTKAERRKRNQKYMILVVSAVMVLSGMFLGLNREQPVTQDSGQDYSGKILDYVAYPVGNASIPVRLESVGEDIILIFSQPASTSSDTIYSILAENISGVDDIIYEYSDSYGFFRFKISNRTKALQGIGNTIRPRDYILYDTYSASSQAGKITVVGKNLSVGDFAKVLLFQRNRRGVFDYLGFARGVVEVGPFVEAQVGNITGWNFEGLFDFGLNESALEFEGISGLKVSMPRFVVHAVGYSMNVSNATGSAQGNETIIDTLDFDAALKKIREDAVDYDILDGMISFNMPLSSNTTYAEGMLLGMGVRNISKRLSGFGRLPADVTDGRSIYQIPLNDRVETSLFENASVGDNITVEIYFMVYPNYTVALAKQI